MKIIKNNNFKYCLLGLSTFLLASCTKEEGAKAEAFFLNVFSLFGMGAVLLTVGLALVFSTLSKGSEYHGLFKILSFLCLFGGVIVLFTWTAILLTDYIHTDAYKYGEGVFIIFFTYLCSCAAFVAGTIYTFNALRKGNE